MTDDRSERLRKRRQRTQQRQNGSEPSTDADTESESSETSDQTADSADEADDQETIPIKEQQVGTYMYLPETQTKELRRLYNVLKAEYEFEYDEEFEKNRHFYPLVVQYGLEGLDGLGASEIRERLEGYYE
jgi:hypothetical protein